MHHLQMVPLFWSNLNELGFPSRQLCPRTPFNQRVIYNIPFALSVPGFTGGYLATPTQSFPRHVRPEDEFC